MSQLKASYPRMELKLNKLIQVFKQLFVPKQSETRSRRIHEEVQDFTQEEIMQVCWKLKPGKAPGPDGIAPEVQKV